MNEQDSADLQDVRARVSFGLDVQVFMGSPIGKYLQRRANADIETALLALKDVDPEDAKAVRKLQNDAKAAERFLEWMGEAVTEGEQAETSFINADAQQG